MHDILNKTSSVRSSLKILTGGVCEPVVLVEGGNDHLVRHCALYERPHHEAAPARDEAELQQETRPCPPEAAAAAAGKWRNMNTNTTFLNPKENKGNG